MEAHIMFLPRWLQQVHFGRPQARALLDTGGAEVR